MAIGSGLGSSFGMAAQTASYTTRVAPDHFLRATSYSINKTYTRVQGEGIVGGAFGHMLDHYVETVQGAEATVGFDVPTKSGGVGLFLNTLCGGTVTPTQIGTTGAYTQTHTLSDPLGKYLTMQLGAPYRDGTVKVHELVGGKVASAEFSMDVTDILKATAQVDGYKFDDSQSLAAPSWATSAVFPGQGASLKLGTFNSEAAVSGVRQFSCNVERALDTEAYTLGGSGYKAEPVLNDITSITGSVTVDWVNIADFQDRVVDNTSCALLFTVTSSTAISGTYYPTFKISLPSVTWTGDVQGVDGRGALQSTWDYTWVYDGTNAPVITYISVDSAL